MAEEEKSATAEIIEENEVEEVAETVVIEAIDAKAETGEEEIAIVPASKPEIRDLIYTVRGVQVMIDSDLAMLYGVETRRINESVSRNKRRFPERFCFRLTREEAKDLRSQIATLDPELGKQETWWRYMPRVFTEQGVSMLSAVLRSDTAIDVSVRIMDSFVEMRRFIAGNAAMFEQIRAVELRQLEYQKTTDERFERNPIAWDFSPGEKSLRSIPAFSQLTLAHQTH